MLTNIVVLYMAYLFNLPAWCKILMGIALAINTVLLFKGIYDAGKKSK